MTHSHVIPLIITECVTKYVDRGNSFYSRYAGKTTLTKMIVLLFLMGMVTKETH